MARCPEFKIIRKNWIFSEPLYSEKFQKTCIFQDSLKANKPIGGPDKDRVFFPFIGENLSEITSKNTATTTNT